MSVACCNSFKSRKDTTTDYKVTFHTLRKVKQEEVFLSKESSFLKIGETHHVKISKVNLHSLNVFENFSPSTAGLIFFKSFITFLTLLFEIT